MTTNIEWWGFRLRVPPGYAPKPVSSVERAMIALSVVLLFEAAWLTVMVLWSGSPASSIQLWTPMALTGLPLILIFLTPRALLEHTGVATWMILAREKGVLSKMDIWLAMAFAVTGVLAVFLPGSSYKTTLVLLLFDAAAGLAALVLQEKISIAWKRWPVEVPDWLRRSLEDEERRRRGAKEPDDTRQDVVIPPDPDARPVYSLEAMAGTSYSVGIRIPSEVIQRLRQINAENHGTLYQREPEAVVLMDRPPVDNVGREDVLRLCTQILSIARKHRLPPLAFANMVLTFVQKAIRYRFDKDSTGEFQGGPYEEYGRFAVETIHDQVGDCECTSLFCASLLAYLGFGVALLWVAVPTGGEDNTVNHVAVGLDATTGLGADISAVGLDFVDAKDGSGKRYLYGETALDGLTLPFGCFPSEWKQLRIDKVTPVIPISVSRVSSEG